MVRVLARDRPRLRQVAWQLIAAAVSLAGVLGAAAVEVGDDLVAWASNGRGCAPSVGVRFHAVNLCVPHR
jgi:hypothetical protein